VSIHLRRRLKEAEDGALMEFYGRLPQCLGRPEAKNDRWQLLDCRSTWPGDENWRQFIVFAWDGEDCRRFRS
jgi:hypothetical protein